MKNILSEILLEGKIPFRPLLQKILLFSAITPIVGIFFFSDSYRELGEICFNLLIAILAIRPLGDIFPGLRIFRGLLPFRKEAGILCGSLGVAHGIGYFLVNNLSFSDIFSSYLYDPSRHFLWGIIAVVIAFLLAITSNLFSMRLLRRNWKRLHRLVYVFFFVTVAHIVLIRMSYEGIFWSQPVLEVFLPAIFLLVLWLFSALKFSFPFGKKA